MNPSATDSSFPQAVQQATEQPVIDQPVVTPLSQPPASESDSSPEITSPAVEAPQPSVPEPSPNQDLLSGAVNSLIADANPTPSDNAAATVSAPTQPNPVSNDSILEGETKLAEPALEEANEVESEIESFAQNLPSEYPGADQTAVDTSNTSLNQEASEIGETVVSQTALEELPTNNTPDATQTSSPVDDPAPTVDQAPAIISSAPAPMAQTTTEDNQNDNEADQSSADGMASTGGAKKVIQPMPEEQKTSLNDLLAKENANDPAASQAPANNPTTAEQTPPASASSNSHFDDIAL
jgi:hypothetical protein